MAKRSQSWPILLGAALLLSSLVVPLVILPDGWLFGCATVCMPIVMLHGQMDLAAWLVHAYGLWMLCYFTTGLFIISRRYMATLIAVAVTYPGLLLWVTFGDLPWVNLLNGGSLQYALFFGDYKLFPGDIERRINLTTWGVTVSLLTLLFSVLLTLLVRNRHAFAIASSISESSSQ